MDRYSQKVKSYEYLLTDQALMSPIKIIRKSKDAIVYTFSHKNKLYRSSAPIEFFKADSQQAYYLEATPKVNSLNPRLELELVRSKKPASWRFPFACIASLLSISFLLSFFSPVFRERMEFWMYKRRET